MTDPRPITVVTGGGRGIGAAIVVDLAGRGHDIVLGYRSDATAAEEVAARARRSGARVTTVSGDVQDPDHALELFAAAADLGQVTGLVNNAGLTGRSGDLADAEVDDIRRVLDVNLAGAIWCARRAAQVMSTSRGGPGGAIVNISSGAATLGSPHEFVSYAAAKAGVEALTVGLSKELGEEGIRVNAVAPGLIDTEIHAAGGDPGRQERIVPTVPMRRAGQPREVAPAVAWLLSPEAGYVTGASIRVAGGR